MNREQRVARGECRESGCGRPAFKGSGRCKAHLVELSDQAKDRRKDRKDAGLCWCGRPLAPGLERCAECAFGEENARDLAAECADVVDVLEHHPRALRKMVRKGSK